MARAIGGIVAGFIAAFVVVIAIELIGLQVFPQPPGMNPMDPESVRQHLPQISPGSFATVILAWGVAALVGPLITRRIAGDSSRWPALTVIALFAALCAYNLVTIPSPKWMIPAAVIFVGTSSLLAMRLNWSRA